MDDNNNTVSTQHGDNKLNDNSSSSSNDGSEGRGMPEKRERTAAEIRKSNKPLMEKRRRERINSCLDQLKSILMEVTKKERSYYSKLEKADILEMTVKYLKNLKRQQMTVAMASDPSVLSKYMAGFNECTSEVTKYLNSVDGMTPDVSTRLLGHLASCLQHGSATAATPGPSGATAGNMALQLAAINQHCALGLPSTTPLSVLPGLTGVGNGVRLLHPSSACPTAVQTVAASPMQLVSAKLPGGELILVLHNPQSTPEVGSVCQPPSAESASAVCTGSSPPKRFLPPAHASASASCSGAVAAETLTSRSNAVASPNKNCDRSPEGTANTNNVSVKKEEVGTACRAGAEASDDDVDDEDDSIYEEDNSREPDRTVWRPW